MIGFWAVVTTAAVTLGLWTVTFLSFTGAMRRRGSRGGWVLHAILASAIWLVVLRAAVVALGMLHP